MEKKFNNKSESFPEMQKIDDLALERMAELIRNMESEEKAVEMIGHDNYLKVQNFLEKEKKESSAGEISDIMDFEDALERNKDDIKDLYGRK